MQDWLKDHIEHAEYNRDSQLVAARLARYRYRLSNRHTDYLEWKDSVRYANAMRKIAKANKTKLKG